MHVYIRYANHNIIFLCFRGVKARGLYLCGRPVMVAVMVTVVTVTGTLIASTRCLSVVLRRTVTYPGTQRLVARH